MLKPPLFLVAAFIGVVFVWSVSSAAEEHIVFRDNFNRDDADAVGNEWSSKGKTLLKDNAAFFQVKGEEFRPRIRHVFPAQKDGKFTASFRMDWLRESEGSWGFYMQLGHSSELPRFLIRKDDLAKGIGVNLVWGGGEFVDSQERSSFGYIKDGKFKALFIANDAQVKKSIAREPVVTIDVDLDSGTYRLEFNGKTYSDLPLASKGPIDTIRFITDGCSATGFSRSSIDDVKITREK